MVAFEGSLLSSTAGTSDELFVRCCLTRMRTFSPSGMIRHLAAFCLFSSAAALDRSLLLTST